MKVRLQSSALYRNIYFANISYDLNYIANMIVEWIIIYCHSVIHLQEENMHWFYFLIVE